MDFSHKKAILFDLDGTLLDSVPDLALSVNEMLEKLHYPTFSEEHIRLWVGNGASTLVKRALLGQSDINQTIDEDFFNDALSFFLERYKQNLAVATRAYPFVLETLKALHQAGYILTIITNKPFEFIEPLLKNLTMEHFFTLYLGANSLSEKKPSPLPLLHTCETLKIDVKDAIMVGDSNNDIISANRANMQSIGVTYGYNYGSSIDAYSPTVIIENFKEILPLFSVKA